MLGCIPRQICRGLIEAGEVQALLDDGSRAFPGKFAGASLKHFYCPNASLGSRSIPRQICRGLIEALDSPIDDDPRWIIPRQICRGLIEAPRAKSNQPPHPPAFPGKFAGASLKRLHRGYRAAHPSAIPRQICRGLIEADKARVRNFIRNIIPRQICRGLNEAQNGCPEGSISVAFPGKFAGASLKHGCRDIGAHLFQSFPGKFAGASLKRLRSARCATGDACIPRQICRGLIEASW